MSASAEQVAPTDARVPQPWRVARTARDTSDTFTLELEAPESFAFRPGQFAMLYVFGVGEVPISYSGDPHRRGVAVHTVREVGAVTRAMARLRRDSSIGVRGPYGSPWPLEGAAGHDVVLLAGGIGIAPLRPTLYAIAARRQDFGRVSLLYGARSPADLLFRRELARLQRQADIDVAVTVDHATQSWPGDVGVVTRLVPRAAIEPGRTIALICGPEVMMRFVAEALRALGVAPTDIWTSLERNMKCAVGLCGRCQLGPTFVCKDGPVFSYDRAERLLMHREV